MTSLLTVEYVGDMQLALGFSDGAQGTFNLATYLANHTGPLLEALRDESFARRVFVDSGALSWPNGLEISPRRIRENSMVLQAAA